MQAKDSLFALAQIPDVTFTSPRTSVSFLPLCFANPGFEDSPAPGAAATTTSPGTCDQDEHDMTVCNHSNYGGVANSSGGSKLRYRTLLQQHSGNGPTLRFGHSDAEEQLRLRIYMQTSGSSSSSSSVSSSSCSRASVSCSQSSIIAEVGAAQSVRTRTNRGLLQQLAESQLQLGHCNSAHNMPGQADSPDSPSEPDSSQEQDSSTPMEYECTTVSQSDDITAVLLATNTADGPGTIPMEAGGPSATVPPSTLATTSITNTTATAAPIPPQSAAKTASTKVSAATKLTEVQEATLSDSQQGSHSATVVAATVPMYNARPQVGEQRRRSWRALDGKTSPLLPPVVSLQEQQMLDNLLLQYREGDENGEGSERPVGRAAESKLGQLLARKSLQLRMEQEKLELQKKQLNQINPPSQWQPMDTSEQQFKARNGSVTCCSKKQQQQVSQPLHHQCQLASEPEQPCHITSSRQDRQVLVNRCDPPRYQRSATAAAQSQQQQNLPTAQHHRCTSPYSSEENCSDDELFDEDFVWPPARFVRDQLMKFQAKRRERRRDSVSRWAADAAEEGSSCCCGLHRGNDIDDQKRPTQWPPQSLPWRGCPVHLTVRVAEATCQEANRLQRLLQKTGGAGDPRRRASKSAERQQGRRERDGNVGGTCNQVRRPVSGAADCSVHRGSGGSCQREVSVTRKTCR